MVLASHIWKILKAFWKEKCNLYISLRMSSFRKCVWPAGQRGKGEQEIAYLPGSQRPGKDIVWAVILFNSTAWLIDARETVGISSFRPTKKIILWWSHVVVSVLWINKAKWTQSFAPCISISRLNALKNMHGVYMMYTTKPSLSQKLRLEKIHLPDYQRK